MTKGIKQTKHIMGKNSPTITTTIVLMSLNPHMSIISQFVSLSHKETQLVIHNVCKSGNPRNSYAKNTGKRTAAVPWHEA